MAVQSAGDQTVTLYYGNKDWFVTVCGLHGHGLVPGQTLTESHISKQECINMFGDKKSNNGYKTSRNPDFIDRVNWLWKRVHQVDKPVNNDVGFHFCQGLVYEHYHGRGTVDWAELAVITVNWYRTSKGVKKVHDDWAYAYPSITIDVFTKQAVCPQHPHGKTPSKPVSPRIAANTVLPTPRTMQDEVRRRKSDNVYFAPNPDREVKRRVSSGGRVKAEYVKDYASPAFNDTHSEGIPNVDHSEGIPNVDHSEGIPNVEASTHEDPVVEIHRTDIPNAEISTSKNPNAETAIPERTPHSNNTVAPKPPADSHELNTACTGSFCKSLCLFRLDIEQAVDATIKNLEAKKTRLQIVMEDARHEVDIATATVKNLKDELELAKSALSASDTDDNRGEVRCIQSAIKSGETKLRTRRAKYDAVSLEWRLEAQTHSEKLQAQKLMEMHFRLQDEAEKLLHIA